MRIRTGLLRLCIIIIAARLCDNYQNTVYALSAGLDKIWGEPWFTKKLVMRTNIIEIHYGKLIMGKQYSKEI